MPPLQFNNKRIISTWLEDFFLHLDKSSCFSTLHTKVVIILPCQHPSTVWECKYVDIDPVTRLFTQHEWMEPPHMDRRKVAEELLLQSSSSLPILDISLLFHTCLWASWGPDYPLVSLSDPVPALAEEEMMTLRDFPAIMWGKQLSEGVKQSQLLWVPHWLSPSVLFVIQVDSFI